MRIERNGHVYDTEKSLFMGVRLFYDQAHKNERTTEKLYQTVTGQFFIHGKGGKYVHTEGTFFARKKVYEMILPKDRHFAETWLHEHCGRTLPGKEEKVYIHPLISQVAKSELVRMTVAESCGLGEMIEKLVEKSY